MYATGTAANPAALLAAIEAFAVTAGFTVDRSTAVYNPTTFTPNDYWLAIHKGAALYLNFWYQDAVPGINLYGGTGYNGANAPDHQATPLQPTIVQFNLGRGPYTGYHFFSTVTAGHYYLHMAVEITGGLWGHMLGGIVNAVGGAAPGLYLASTWWEYTGGYFASYPEAGFVHSLPFIQGTVFSHSLCLCTVDAVLTWFSAQGSVGSRIRPLQVQNGPGWHDRGIKHTPNTFNELTVLFPMPLMLERVSTNIYSWIGDLFDVRLCNMQTTAPKDESTIGGDTWKYFPFVAKTPPSTWNIANNPPTSGPFGIAYRKNA